MTIHSKVPVFILAGGLGTRLSEETALKPKPMVEIGETPILVHIMRWYYAHGFNDFVICAGYKAWEIKDYFVNYQYRQNDLCIDHRFDSKEAPKCSEGGMGHENWRVRVVDTGLETMTGGRLAIALERARLAGGDFDQFAVTYGDGLCDIDLTKEFEFHQKHGRIGTMLGVPPLSRFGAIESSSDGVVKSFIEKPEAQMGLINGGFFFFKKAFEKYLSKQTDLILERKPLEAIVSDNQLVVYEHPGFWQCMDTLRDRQQLQKIWDQGRAPWKPTSSPSVSTGGLR